MQDHERTCAERIGDQLDDRLTDFRALADLADCGDAIELGTLLEDRATRAAFLEIVGEQTTAFATDTADTLGAMIGTDGLDELLSGLNVDDIAERARESLYELPLGVSRKTVFRVELSTGGPADWLDIVCSGDTPQWASVEATYSTHSHYAVERIVYHFADWFDHAERELTGAEFDIAERFACSVVPELIA